eukprot:Rmarinus@m.23031
MLSLTLRRLATGRTKLASIAACHFHWSSVHKFSSSDNSKSIWPVKKEKSLEVPLDLTDDLRSRSVTVKLRAVMLGRLREIYQQYPIPVVATVGGITATILWRVSFGIASTFIDVAETFAEVGLMFGAAGSVALAWKGIHWYYHVDPGTASRLAYRAVHDNEEVVRTLGTPLTTTQLRAYVISGGGFKMEGMKPKIRRRHAHILFPVYGPDGRGIVSVEAKKKKGRTQFKVLAVDTIDKRILIEGDLERYEDGVLSELRDPMVNAMIAEADYDDEDLLEEIEDRKQLPRSATNSSPEAAEPSASEKNSSHRKGQKD